MTIRGLIKEKCSFDTDKGRMNRTRSSVGAVVTDALSVNGKIVLSEYSIIILNLYRGYCPYLWYIIITL